MSNITDMIAVIFGEDQKAIGQLLVHVPDDMEQAILVEQVIALARVEGVLQQDHGDMVYIAMRPFDEEEDDYLVREEEQRTVH